MPTSDAAVCSGGTLKLLTMDSATHAWISIERYELVKRIYSGTSDGATSACLLSDKTEEAVENDENTCPAVLPWQNQAAALHALRSLLERTLLVGDSSARLANQNAALEFCEIVWKLHQQAMSCEQASVAVGANGHQETLLTALVKVCADIRSQLAKDGLDFLGWFGEFVLGPALEAAINELETSMRGASMIDPGRSQPKQALKRELAALKQQRLQEQINDTCGLRSGSTWRRPAACEPGTASVRSSDSESFIFLQAQQLVSISNPASGEMDAARAVFGDDPVAAASKRESAVTHQLNASASASRRRAPVEIALYLFRFAIFPVLIRTKKVFYDAADACAHRLLQVLRDAASHPSFLFPVLQFLLKACAGAEQHPVLRERCGMYACLVLQIGRKSESAVALPRAAQTTVLRQDASSLWSDAAIRSEIEYCIRLAIRDSQAKVRFIARQLFGALRAYAAEDANSMVERLPPEDRRRLVENTGELAHSEKSSGPGPRASSCTDRFRPWRQFDDSAARKLALHANLAVEAQMGALRVDSPRSKSPSSP
jgi:hypothetical protein